MNASISTQAATAAAAAIVSSTRVQTVRPLVDIGSHTKTHTHTHIYVYTIYRHNGETIRDNQISNFKLTRQDGMAAPAHVTHLRFGSTIWCNLMDGNSGALLFVGFVRVSVRQRQL